MRINYTIIIFKNIVFYDIYYYIKLLYTKRPLHYF
jgi:hypothetical protein